MTRIVYDPISNESLAWQPLRETIKPARQNSLGDQAIMEIGAFGTCGRPDDPGYVSWRTKHLLPVLELYGVQDRVFNPEVPNWTPQRAPVEGVHLARASDLVVAVTKQAESNASIMEAGFAAHSGVLRGQDVTVFIEEGDGLSEEGQVIRGLAKSVLEATAAEYPLFTLTDDLSVLSHRAGSRLSEKINLEKSGVSTEVHYKLPGERQDLVPGVYLTGTLGPKKPAWMRKITSIISGFDVPLDDTYQENWHPDKNGLASEMRRKLSIAVQLVAITGEREGFGPLAELGPRIMHAHLSGQSIGVYIEPHPSAPDSRANRTRILAREHLASLQADFPDLPVFVAQNIEELAIFGLSEFFKQRQRLQLL